MNFKKISLLIVLLLIADQALKIWIKTHMHLDESIVVFPDWFQLRFIENNGAAFGMHIASRGGFDWGKLLLGVFRIVMVGFIGWLMHLCDDTFETPGVDFMQDCVDAADTRTGRDTAACRGPLRLRSGNRLRRFGRQLYGKTPPQRQPRSRGTQHPGLPSAIAAGRVRRLFRTGKYRQQPAEE